MDFTYKPEFTYKHDNPYHDRLEEFSDFVMRDLEGESFKGTWKQKYFKKEAPLYLEIGTGHGDFMMEFCKRYPESNFVGLDYRFKRSFTLAKKLSLMKDRNFCYLRARGERINFMFDENELDGIFFFFSDPWPKTRHNKKRLFQQPFLDQAYKSLKPGGKIYIKTDHDDYAVWMEKIIQNNMQKESQFTLEFHSKDLWQDLSDAKFKQEDVPFLSTFKTKFETIFIGQGTKIKSFVLTTTKKATERGLLQ